MHEMHACMLEMNPSSVTARRTSRRRATPLARVPSHVVVVVVVFRTLASGALETRHARVRSLARIRVERGRRRERDGVRAQSGTAKREWASRERRRRRRRRGGREVIRFDSIRFDSQLCLSRQRGFRYNARAM